MKAGPERELLDRYVKRVAAMAPSLGLAPVDWRELDESRAKRPEERKAEEARAILAALPDLRAVLLGLALVGVGTFLAQAIVTGYVARAAQSDRGTASGLYLASYFSGGLVGSAALGAVFQAFGWTGCVVGIVGALLAAIGFTTRFVPRPRAS